MTDPTSLAGEDDVLAHLARTCFTPRASDPVRGLVGLEAEVFCHARADRRRPTLDRLCAAMDTHRATARDDLDGRPTWRTADGQLTTEPGGQLELITDPEPTIGVALDRLDALAVTAREALDGAGLSPVGTGLDPFHPPESLEVQLELPRYAAMTTYFGRRGTNGRALMCASASLQVNLDLGPPELAATRSLVANMIAPAVVATFANSPTSEAVNGRALAWMRLDPTRTGIPAILAAGVDDPVRHLAWAALRADVMFTQRDGVTEAGRPRWSFADWLRDGHPRHGRPTTADLDRHVTTLFPEVRLRGFLEVRGVDQLPRRMRPAPAVLLAGLLYDPQATEAARALLEPVRRDLPRMQDRAARRGLTDPVVWHVAEPLWELALEGARRLGEDVGPTWLTVAEDYLERFTRRRRHPADEQRDLRRRGPDAALEWMA